MSVLGWIWDKVKASADPTGYSEGKNALGDFSSIGGWLKGAGNSLMGNNPYRAPESVYQPQANYQGSQAAQNSQADRSQAQTALNNMGQSNSYYQGLMSGKTPSLAENQMKQGIAQAQNAAMQQASGARGMDRAAAFRQAQNNSAAMGAQGAIAGGQQRLQEQQLGAQGFSQGLQAQNNMAQTTRQQDIGEQQNLEAMQNQAQTNLNQQYGINAGITNANYANSNKVAVAGIGATGNVLAHLLPSDIRAKENILPGVIAERPQQMGNLAQAFRPGGASMAAPDQTGQGDIPGLNSFGSALGDYLANNGSDQATGQASGESSYLAGLNPSDENSKENLKGVHPYTYDYKDGMADHLGKQAAQSAYVRAFTDAKTPRTGVMAQDLAANPESSDTVVNTPDGLAIDGRRAMSFMLANQADINDRLKALETGNGRAA